MKMIFIYLFFMSFSISAMRYNNNRGKGTALHKLAYRHREYAPVSVDLPMKDVDSARALCAQGANIFALDRLGKTAKEHAFYNNPFLFRFLDDLEKTTRLTLKNDSDLFFSLLPLELILEIGHFCNGISTNVLNSYVLRRLTEPEDFDRNNPDLVNQMQHIEQGLKKYRGLKRYWPEIGASPLKILCSFYREKTDLLPKFLMRGISIRKAFNCALYESDAPILEQVCQLMDHDQKSYILNEPHKKNGMIPLFEAVTFTKMRCIKILIENGANIKARNAKGETVLHNAIKIYCSDRFGIPNSYKKFCNEPLYLALVRHLCDNGADLDALDYNGNTPLMLAKRICNGQEPEYYSFPSIVKLLEDQMKKRSHEDDAGANPKKQKLEQPTF